MLNDLFFTSENIKKDKIQVPQPNEIFSIYCIILGFMPLKLFKAKLNFFGRWTNSNLYLFELIHFDKNMKKEMKNQTCWFLKIIFRYTLKKAACRTCVN